MLFKTLISKKTNYIVCFKTLKKEKKKEGKTVQEPKLLLLPNVFF